MESSPEFPNGKEIEFQRGIEFPWGIQGGIPSLGNSLGNMGKEVNHTRWEIPWARGMGIMGNGISVNESNSREFPGKFTYQMQHSIELYCD